jgi:hypothetical protein
VKIFDFPLARIHSRPYSLRMANTATARLEAAIGEHNARMSAHAAHAIKVNAMYCARAKWKKNQATKAEYEKEWTRFNVENDLLKRIDLRPIRAMAAEVGVEIKVLKGWKLAIAVIPTA